MLYAMKRVIRNKKQKLCCASLVLVVLIANAMLVMHMWWSTTTRNTNITATSILRNGEMSGWVKNANQIEFPGLLQNLPYISDEQSALTLSHKLSKRQYNKKASIVFGINHVRRSKQSYLITTLHSLFNNLTQQDITDTLFVVFIGETDIDYVMNVSKTIENTFKQYIEFGVIEVISPSQHYYPDFDKTFTKQTLGDPLKRVHWRTKQNLDYAYLMSYSYTKGDYYMIYEDDVIAKHGYLTEIRKRIVESNNNNDDWFLITFCKVGVRAILFKCSDLPQLISFYLIFKSEQPCDLLIDYLIEVKTCRNCKEQRSKLMRKYFDPPLFHHIGFHSSLDGKVQTQDC